jgi:glycosyltransferase involved in cell wall biosynthesis
VRTRASHASHRIRRIGSPLRAGRLSRDPLRILHVSHSALPVIGGVELYLDTLVRGQSTDHCVAILVPDEHGGGPPLPQPPSADTSVRRYTVPGTRAMHTFRDTYASHANEVAARAAIADFRPDVVHVHQLTHLGIGLLRNARALSAGVVMTLHDYGLECANGGQRWHPELGLCTQLDAERCAQCTVARTAPALALLRLAGGTRTAATTPASESEPHRDGIAISRAAVRARLRPAVGRALREGASWLGLGRSRRIDERWAAIRSACEAVDIFLAPSEFIAAELVDFGIDPNRIRVLPRGLSIPAHRRHDRLPETAHRFGYIGSLVPHKGVHVLIESFNRMPEDCSLTLHGDLAADPAYVDRLRTLCRHDRIQLSGPLANCDVAEWLADLHCLVSPSIWWENHPTSVVEAFAAGVPVVGSAIGGQGELLSPGGGLGVPPGDVGALTDALLRVATEPGLLTDLAARIRSIPSEADHLASLDRSYAEASVSASHRA